MVGVLIFSPSVLRRRASQCLQDEGGAGRAGVQFLGIQWQRVAMLVHRAEVIALHFAYSLCALRWDFSLHP